MSPVQSPSFYEPAAALAYHHRNAHISAGPAAGSPLPSPTGLPWSVMETAVTAPAAAAAAVAAGASSTMPFQTMLQTAPAVTTIPAAVVGAATSTAAATVAASTVAVAADGPARGAAVQSTGGSLQPPRSTAPVGGQPSTPRPLRDDHNPFFSHMDEAVARLNPSARPKKKNTAVGTSSRRPPSAPVDAAAAIAAAALARRRVTDRRRNSTIRRDAAQSRPLTEEQTALAALAGGPVTSGAPAAALMAASTAISGAISRMTASGAAGTDPAAGASGLANSLEVRQPCPCAPVLVEVNVVLKAILEAHALEHKAAAADFMMLRKALAVVLSTSSATKDTVDQLHGLANSTSLSVDRLATSSSALAHNRPPVSVGGQRPDGDQHQEKAGVGTSGTANTVAELPAREAPWAIPMQVCAADELRLHVNVLWEARHAICDGATTFLPLPYLCSF